MQKNATAPSLVFKNTTCVIEDISLFSPISLTVRPGHGLVITGQNGMGKTTLLKCIEGVSSAYLGTIHKPNNRIFIQTKRPFEKERTVRQNLAFWQDFYGSKHTSNLESALADWHLTPLQDIPFKKLSEGQQQRLNLARLSLTSADLWLLDEPFSFLDTAVQKLLWHHIEKHLNAGGICVLVHHHFDVKDPASELMRSKLIKQNLDYPHAHLSKVAS